MGFMCAQLDADGIVQSVARLKGPIEGANVIPLGPEVDTSELIGKRYEGGAFVEVVAVKPAATPEQTRLAELAAKAVQDMTTEERQEEILMRLRGVTKPNK